jgi:hypothetical protein
MKCMIEKSLKEKKSNTANYEIYLECGLYSKICLY